MTDVIMIVIGLISVFISILGFYFLDKEKYTNNNFNEDKIKLLREEKILFNKKSNKKKKSIPRNVEKLSLENSLYLYQIAKENNLSVGELLLAVKIKSLK